MNPKARAVGQQGIPQIPAYSLLVQTMSGFMNIAEKPGKHKFLVVASGYPDIIGPQGGGKGMCA